MTKVQLDIPRSINPTGLKLCDDEQWYEITKTTSSEDGLMQLLTWRSECADCGAEFLFTTGYKVNKNFNRRCQAHRHQGQRPHRNSRSRRRGPSPLSARA
jgi:hypothetical protein